MVTRFKHASTADRATMIVVALIAVAFLTLLSFFVIGEHSSGAKLDKARADKAKTEQARRKLAEGPNGAKFEQYNDLKVAIRKATDTRNGLRHDRGKQLDSAKKLEGTKSDLSAQVASLITIPDVTNLPVYEASSTLESLGLTTEYGTKLAAVTFSGSCAAFAEADSDTVLKTAPGVGTKVPYGTKVYLGTYYPSGDSWQAAESRCDDASSSDSGDGYDGYFDY